MRICLPAPDLGAGAAILILLIGLAAPLDSVAAPVQRAAAIAIFAVLMWTLQPRTVESTSLVILILLPLTDQLTFAETFGPFAGSTVWLVFAGMVLSRAVETTALGDRLTTHVFRGARPSPFRLLIGTHILGVLLAFVVPSGVIRVLLLTPIGAAMVTRIGAREDRLASAAVHLSIICSTYSGGAGILTGSVPNLVVAGQLEVTTGHVVYWGEFAQWMLPVTGLLRASLSLLVIWVFIGRRLDPSRWQRRPATRRPASTTPFFDSKQIATAVILTIGVGAWATDAWHHLEPVYVGLILIAACALPGIGPLQMGDLRQINYPFLAYLVALFGLGTALQHSGFNDLVVGSTIEGIDMAAYGWFGRHFALILAILPLDFLMDTGAVAGVATSTMIEIGARHGISDLAAAMCVAMSTSFVIFPYQAAPLMVGLSTGKFSIGQLLCCTAAIALLSLFALFPLNIIYWKALALI